MTGSQTPKQRARRRSWPLAEKRQIVELTQRGGASVVSIAREHGVHPNSVYQWIALNRIGNLDAKGKLSVHVAGSTVSAPFMPVCVAPEVCSAKPTIRRPDAADAAACRRDIVQLVFASGATLRIETGALDVALVCSIVAELQR